jgi:hypothetical protein
MQELGVWSALSLWAVFLMFCVSAFRELRVPEMFYVSTDLYMQRPVSIVCGFYVGEGYVFILYWYSICWLVSVWMCSCIYIYILHYMKVEDFGVKYWYKLKLSYPVFGKICLVCGCCETDVKISGVYMFYSVCKVKASGGMVFTCSYDVLQGTKYWFLKVK